MVGSYDQTPWIRDLMESLAVQPSESLGYTFANGLLRFKGKVVAGDDKTLRRILTTLHESPMGGHSGIRATYHKVRHLFF